MFPGAGAQVYYNEAGEPLGWDYPDLHDYNEWYDDDGRDEMDEEEYEDRQAIRKEWQDKQQS